MKDSAQATIQNNTVISNWNGIMMWHSVQVTTQNNPISGTDQSGIFMKWSTKAIIRDNNIFDNEGYGVALELKACVYEEDSFKGEVRGSGNEIHDNGKGDVCPSDLEFLLTEEGGCYGEPCD